MNLKETIDKLEGIANSLSLEGCEWLQPLKFKPTVIAKHKEPALLCTDIVRQIQQLDYETQASYDIPSMAKSLSEKLQAAIQSENEFESVSPNSKGAIIVRLANKGLIKTDIDKPKLKTERPTLDLSNFKFDPIATLESVF